MITLWRWDFRYHWHGRKASLFHEGDFLQVDEVRKALEEYEAREGRTPKMLSKFRNADDYFRHFLSIYRSLKPMVFQVSQLRHVTIKKHFLDILEEEGFRGSRITFLLNGERRNLRVSCWGVDIPPDTIEHVKEDRFQEFTDKLAMEGVPCNDLYEEDSEEVRDMLANSPVWTRDSRYGNFRFSFPIEDLLKEYRRQHCQGKQPVLRVLGTETFTQEIVHWVLVHSPQSKDFDHLPTVYDQGPLYWKRKQLLWAPESMTDQFTWYISRTTRDLEKKPLGEGKYGPIQTYNAWVWNNPVFAFYLPGTNALEMDRSRLVNNVQSCETMASFGGTSSRVLRHPFRKYVSQQKATRIINDEKWS